MDDIGDAYDASLPSSSVIALFERERHFQKRELVALPRRIADGCLSAQYPSGNQTYSYPSRGGRGGSTPKEGEGLACGEGVASGGEETESAVVPAEPNIFQFGGGLRSAGPVEGVLLFMYKRGETLDRSCQGR